MKNFQKIVDVIDEITNEYARFSEQKILSPKLIEYRVEKDSSIKILLKKEFDSHGILQFCVLYLVQLKNPYKSIEFGYSNFWLNNPDISRIVKVSCLRNETAIIKSSHFSENNEEKIDSIIRINDDSDFGEFFGNEEKNIDLNIILDALRNTNLPKFYNGFNTKKNKTV